MEDRLISNRRIRFALLGVQSVMGHNGLNAMLKMAGLARYMNALPADNKKYDAYTSEYAELIQTIENHFGSNARIQLIRMGHGTFRNIYNTDKARWQVHALFNRFLPSRQRAINALNRLATYLSEDNIQARVEVNAKGIVLIDPFSPATWNRERETEMCWLTLGAINECVLWATGDAYEITEEACKAIGSETCRFVVGKEI